MAGMAPIARYFDIDYFRAILARKATRVWPYQRQPIFRCSTEYVAQTGMARSAGFVHAELHVSSARWRTSGSWILGIRQAPDSLRAPRIDPILRLPRPHLRANNPKKQAKPPPDCRTRRRLVQSNWRTVTSRFGKFGCQCRSSSGLLRRNCGRTQDMH